MIIEFKPHYLFPDLFCARVYNKSILYDPTKSYLQGLYEIYDYNTEEVYVTNSIVRLKNFINRSNNTGTTC